MTDAKPEQQTRRIGLTLGLDRGKQIIDRFFLPAFAADKFVAVAVKAENVGWRREPAEI